MEDIVARSDRIYRLILHVYPRAFRDEYGAEMAQTMRDQVRDAWSERRGVGVIGLWLKVLADTARSAFIEHLKQGRSVGLSRRGLGYGLATAIGFPLAIVSFLAWSGELVGFERAENWPHPALASTGFVLAGIGLHGLYKRLEIDTTILIATVWVGVTLGLYGTADIYSSGEFFGWYAITAGFVLLTSGLATMGRVALRNKSFGPFSFVPLAVAASGGLWFLVLLVGSGGYRDVMRTSTLLAHVALWFILGVLLWGDPPGSTDAVRAAEEKRPATVVTLIVVALAAGLWWLNSPAAVEIATAEMVPEGGITAMVNSCGGDLNVDVYEDDSLVLVKVVDHRTSIRFSTDNCRDVIHISLTVPLGNRMLVDRATREPVPLS